jgi:hypothetical protein
MRKNIERIRIPGMLIVSVYFIETYGRTVYRFALEGSKKAFTAGHKK